MQKVPVVLRFKDGRMDKCFTGPYFSHSLKVVQVIHEEGDVITVPVEDLKAVFFVDELDGKGHPKTAAREDDPGALKAGRTVTITFADGERMRGKLLGEMDKGAGFFVFPIERDSNNRKVFVVRSAVKETVFEG